MTEVRVPVGTSEGAFVLRSDGARDDWTDEGPTIGDVVDALEERHPVLRGTIREHGTRERRAFMRYFACEEDLSHDPPDTQVPGPVAAGDDPFRVVTAIAGG